MARGFVINVPNVNEVLQFFDQIAVFRSSDRIAAYTEITTLPGYGGVSRIILLPNVTSYTFIDPGGAPTDWYRTAFISTFTGIQGELTPPIQSQIIDPKTLQPRSRFNTSDGATFADGYGFDGTFDIPATGGSRTNRNPDGYGTKGYWDGVGGSPNSGIELLCTRPLTPRGECFKNKCVAMTRVMLKDIDSSCWAFQEDEIDMFLEASLADFNAEPTFTNFNWHDLEDRWLHVIALGAQVMALYAQGLIEVGREFVITDNGISFQPPAISNYMQSTASQLLGHYDQLKQRIKSNMKPRPQGIGLFQPLAIHPAFLRLRHLRERRLF
jgi:hypothetical protein